MSRSSGKDLHQETNFSEVPDGGKPPPYSPITPPTHSSPVPTKDPPHVESKTGCGWKKLVLLGVGVVVLVAVVTGIVLATTKDPDPDTTTTTTEPPVTSPVNGWTHWSEWSKCSESCGLGTMYRTRECVPPGNPVCVGSDSQVTNCYLEKCPRPAYGEWSSWGGWSSCSVSCDGGVQSRERTCEKNPPDAEDCTGSDTQSRRCAAWDCPSCSSRGCPNGGIPEDPGCERCNCTGEEFHGKVTSSNNLPLENATVVDQDVPNFLLATSDSEGYFFIQDACRFTTLLIHAVDHAEQYYDIVDTGADVKSIMLQKIAKLQIGQHPQEKMRRAGDSVTFCCSASGNPPPDYYEWFHNNFLIDPATYNYTNELSLTGLTTEHSGRYKCRASNDYSAVYSSVVSLTVIDKSEAACQETPNPYEVELPPGCTYEGQTKFDIGQCSGATCRSDNETDSGQCKELSLYCCSAVSYNSFYADCSGSRMKVSYIDKCGCVKCSEPYIEIKGKVMNSISKEPIAYVVITSNGTELGRAGINGDFGFSLPPDTVDIVLRFQDIYSQHVESTKQLFFPNGYLGIYTLNVAMLPKAPEIVVSSSEDQLLDIGSGDAPAYAKLLIPANKTYKEDGTPYTGDIRLSINSVDPRNTSDFLNLPSELTYLDDEGNTQRLQSFGMFSLSLLDDNGGILQVRGKVSLAIDLGIFGPQRFKNGEGFPKLWSLDPTLGQWVFKSDMALANETYISQLNSRFANAKFSDIIAIGETEIDVDYTWTNFDGNTDKACHSKIRLFKDNTFQTQVTDAVITVLSRVGEETTFEKASIPSWSQQNDGFCMIHTCDIVYDDTKTETGYNGFIIAEGKGHNPDGTASRYIAAKYTELNWKDSLKDDLEYDNIYEEGNHAVQVKFDATENIHAGPFYHWDGDDDDGKKWAYSEACAKADINQPYFAFYQVDSSSLGCTEDLIPHEEVKPEYSAEENYLAWFPNSLASQYDVCYIKVNVSGWHSKPVTAISKVGNNTQAGIKPGDIYGQTFECPQADVDTVCLEFKAPGPVTDGSGDSSKTVEDETHLEVFPMQGGTPACGVNDVRLCLGDTYGGKIINTNDKFEMYVQNADFGDHFGIYCGSANNPDKARNDVRNLCLGNGKSKCNTNDQPDYESGWGVKFKCD